MGSVPSLAASSSATAATRASSPSGAAGRIGRSPGGSPSPSASSWTAPSWSTSTTRFPSGQGQLAGRRRVATPRSPRGRLDGAAGAALEWARHEPRGSWNAVRDRSGPATVTGDEFDLAPSRERRARPLRPFQAARRRRRRQTIRKPGHRPAACLDAPLRGARGETSRTEESRGSYYSPRDITRNSSSGNIPSWRCRYGAVLPSPVLL